MSLPVAEALLGETFLQMKMEAHIGGEDACAGRWADAGCGARIHTHGWTSQLGCVWGLRSCGGVFSVQPCRVPKKTPQI